MTALRDDVGWGIPPVISHSGFAGRCGALSGRMACLLAVALLVCVSVAQGQAIEEGGFPVKGGGVSGESFSLFCPARLVVEAGESVLLSCSATDVPEEGVRYDWVSISGDGFYLLSASDELSPLFTAPLSGAGEEYAYRLTAMAAGEYRTASLTVSVEGVPGETIGAPVVREECDPFTVPEGLGAGCVEDKGPAPFGFGSVAEFPFPEAPGLPDRPSGPDRGGGSVMQAPPRLECPVAIFLEELETGSIECRAWDASGEEHLDYSWKPVGGTTRDYLENPRLIPEDSPTPSVVAPEAPAYETLESFRSVETTFRYRYRLTAMSRATGLSSSSEVEVFVSSSRPSVYCPLEVAVEEGATIALDCEGVDPLSSRMDYDEEEASVLWEWEGLWGASTALLDATDRSSPLFTAPPNSAGEAYHYIASMTSSSSGRPSTARRRVTVTVVGEEEGTRASSDASAPAYKAGAPVITCNDAEIYEATEDFTLDCSVTDEPSGATYRWTGPDIENRLTGTDSLTPTFSPPDNVYWDTEYEYNVTMTVAGSDTASAVVVVTVLEKPNIISCIVYRTYSVEEGAADLVFIGCLDPPQGAPGDDPVYRYMWVNSGITPSSALSLLSRTDISNPVFGVPDDVQQDTIYEYSLIISADNADEYTTQYTVTVLDLDRGAFNLACASSTFEVYQGSEDIELECEAPGAPEGVIWEWTARVATTDTDRLSATDIPNPVFDVPDYYVPIGTEGLYFYYTVSVSAGSQREEKDLGVRVVRSNIFSIACEAQASFFEGDNDRTIGNCFVTRANDRTTPVSFEWEWLSRGTTADTDRLSATDIPNPVFDVPDSIDKHETYEYTLQITWDSSRGSGRGSYFVSVTVLDRDAFDGALALVCMDPGPVYEGSEDITLDCAASGASDGAEYSYVWEPRGDTPHTARLIAGTDGPTPTFAAPSDVERDRAYTYRVTVTAGNSIPASANVTVTVLNRGTLAVACMDPDPVYEGSEDITLDCAASGASDGAEYSYVWEPRGDTPHTARLIAGTDGPTPTFAAPRDVERDRTYTYRVTVTAGNSIPASANVTVTVLNRGTLAVACTDPDPVYEGSEDITLDCTASGAPEGSGYSYAWTSRGATSDTARLIAGTDGPTPTFAAPRDVERDRAYTYRVTVTAGNSIPASANVTVTVLNRGTLAVACTDPDPVYEGSEDITLDCSASGAPEGSVYAYAWTARGSTATTDLLTDKTLLTPAFLVPDDLDETTTYEYLLTASAENAEDATAEVTVTVLNRGSLVVACTDPDPVYEGSEDITLDCSASGAPEGSVYAYAWTARGSTATTDLLTDKTLLTPAFLVPDDLDETTTYEYLLTASAENAEDATAEVTVTVLNRGSLVVACTDPDPVYEGSEDIALDCTASGAPEGSVYAYAWTARGSTATTDLLTDKTLLTPAFLVPDDLDETTTYEYLLTASAENAEDATAEVTVTVLNRGSLVVACTDPDPVYEGSEDITLDCSASGAPEGSVYAYAWTARGSTATTDLLTDKTLLTPAFLVPDDLDETTTYEYLLTASAENAEDATAEVTVTVLNRGSLVVACTDPDPVYEGSEDITLDCSASGAPEGSVYAYAWTARGSTATTDLLTDKTLLTPAFLVPDDLDETTTYEYLLTASAENAEDATAEVTVTVLNRGSLVVACTDPDPVYEGSEDITLDCSASGAPEGSVYAYAWTARGSTATTDLLTDKTLLTPAFLVPDDLDETTTYEYLLTASAENAEDATAEVTVTVLNRGTLAVACTDPDPVYEGSEDIALDCTASGAPEGSVYAYAWTARGSTATTDLLTDKTLLTPAFLVPDDLDETTTYEYLLTASAENAEDATAEVTVTVLNRGSLVVACTDPDPVYEGSEDITLDCSASGAPEGSVYAYAWTARGSTATTDLLTDKTLLTPAFLVPDDLDETTTYEYLLTASAENAEDATAEVTVTVLNRGSLVVACTDPDPVYEGSEDIALDCTASGAPEGSVYAYAWTARGSTATTDLLTDKTLLTPAFLVPDDLDETTTYEYLLTASAENAEDATAEVTVTVLNRGSLVVACTDPDPVYEGSEDITLDCSASGAPEGSVYAYAWTARGSTATTDLLTDKTLLTPAFLVPDDLDETTTYEYLLTASAENAEDATAEVSVTVLDRVEAPPSDPVSRPLASSSAPEPAEPSALGVTVSASPLRFGVQLAETEVSLDPMTDRISTQVSGPYHAGRMTLSPGSGEALDENGEMALSIELASPVTLRHEGVEGASIVLSPSWSYAESCEQLSSQSVGGLYTEVTLTEGACRLLHFGGELNLVDVPSGYYAGRLDLVLRSGQKEETHSVQLDVMVVPAQGVITIGPGGVRFSTSRELAAGLTEEQNLSIYPDVAFLTGEKPHGVFELSNPSLVPLEVSVSARYGYTEATEDGREVVVEDTRGSRLGDLSSLVDIHPSVLVLMPGEKGFVRYGVQAEAFASMGEKGYAAFFDVVSEPRQYVRSDRMPEAVTGERTARVTMRVPGVYVPREGASQLRATLLSLSSFPSSMSATFLLETADVPFAGEVLAYDGEGRELGRRETLVYTRSRVRLPLDRMPEEGTVFLRFAPRGGLQAPEPVSVPWDAPRRDIGAVQNEYQALPSVEDSPTANAR